MQGKEVMINKVRYRLSETYFLCIRVTQFNIKLLNYETKYLPVDRDIRDFIKMCESLHPEEIALIAEEPGLYGE